MRSGKRKFHKDTKITSVEGNEHEFKKDDIIDVKIINKRNGLCRIVAGAETYKCKKIKGLSTLVD